MNNFIEMGARLREERERLGFNQTAFGEVAGVRKQAQLNYEKGERNPDAAYLAAIAAAGADVLYILTGQRMAGAVPALSRDEAIVLDHYRHCDDDGKAFMKQAGAVASKPKAKKASGE
jgi:transcriptional regulator with XRE-family HTH domain